MEELIVEKEAEVIKKSKTKQTILPSSAKPQLQPQLAAAAQLAEQSLILHFTDPPPPPHPPVPVDFQLS